MNKNNSTICANQEKKMTFDNRILASAIFLNAKVVGQERKWVDLTDND